MLQFANVSFTYSSHGEPLQAISALDLGVKKGSSLAIIGPSGCGKSTSLLLAAGLLEPTSGSVFVDGEPISSPRKSSALILQDFGLLPWKTVLQNAALGLQIRKMPRKERESRATGALEAVGLSEFLNAFPSELSGGMRQRLALARALALDVDLLLMDEPLSAVDTMLREALQDLLLSLWRERGYTQVLVTHSIEEAVFLGETIVVMTSRPGAVKQIVQNPQVGDSGYRNTETFYAKCVELRNALAGHTPSFVKGAGGHL